MPILRIYFSGLCSFVPNEQKTGMTVLLNEGRKAGDASNNQRLFPHIPVLWLNGLVLLSRHGPNTDFPLNYQYNGSYIVPLNGDELSIAHGDGSSLPNQEIKLSKDFDKFIPKMSVLYKDYKDYQDSSQDSSQDSPQSYSKGSLKGSKNLSQDSFELSDYTKVHDDTLKPIDQAPLDSRLAARIPLKGGIIDIPSYNLDETRNEAITTFFKVSFESTDNTGELLADRVVYIREIDKEHESFKIYFRRWKKDIGVVIKEIEVKFPDDDTPADIFVMNLPPNTVTLHESFHYKEDKDFEMVHYVANKIPSRMKVSRIIKSDLTNIPPGWCGMATYDSHKDA